MSTPGTATPKDAKIELLDALKKLFPASIASKLKFGDPATDFDALLEVPEKFLPDLLMGTNHNHHHENFLNLYGGCGRICKDLADVFDAPKLLDFRDPSDLRKQFPEPIIYRNLGGKQFVSKQGLLVNFEHFILQKSVLPDPELHMLLAFFRCQYRLLEKDWDLVPWLDYSQRHGELLAKENTQQYEEEAKKIKTRAELLEAYVELVTDQQDLKDLVRTILLESFNERDTDSVQSSYAKMKAVFNALRNLFNEYKESFLPFRVLKSQDPTTVVTWSVRIFEDKKMKFVMKDELFRALGREKEPFFSDDCIDTIDANTAMRMAMEMPKNGDKVEFIITPVIRTKHSAVQIRTGDGTVCKLASDVLLEMLFDMTFGLKVFSQTTPEKWKSCIEDIFGSLSKYLDQNIVRPFFIKKTGIEAVIKYYTATYKNYLKDNIPAVRKVANPTFTFDQFSKELHRLGLERTFPDISINAKFIYDKMIVKTGKEKSVTTTDVFELVEKTVLKCFLEKMKPMAKFLHWQNGCEVVPYSECCVNGVLNDDFWKEESSEASANPPKPALKPEKTEIRKLAGLLQQQESLEVPMSPLPKVSICNQESKTKKQRARYNKKRLKGTFTYRRPVTDQSAPSAVCSKCFRTSQYCKKLKERLRESEKKKKNMEKEENLELKNMKLENKKLNEQLEKVHEDFWEWLAKANEGNSEVLYFMEENERFRLENDELQKQVENLKLEQIKNVGGSGSEAELREQLEKVQRENMMLKVENQELKSLKKPKQDEHLIAENTMLRAQLEEAHWKLEMTPQNHAIWLECRDREDQIKSEDPLGSARRKLAKILENSTDKVIKEAAQIEYGLFRNKFLNYQKELERRLRVLKINPKLDSRGFLALPDLPWLSEMFETAYENLI